MTAPLVFISYKHAPPFAEMARLLHLKLKPVCRKLKSQLYIDTDTPPGAEWQAEVDKHLAMTSHLVVLLCDAYWESDACMHELYAVTERFGAAKANGAAAPRLLFVRAADINPAYLTFDEGRERGILSHDPRINSVADINFLGPYDLDGNRQLEILRHPDEDPFYLDRQLGQLRDRLVKTLPAPG